MRVVYMGTPDFAVPALENLAREGFDIPLVITQEDRRRGRGKKLHPTKVKAKALELGLDVYQPESVNSDETIGLLKDINPDVIVVAAYGQILKKDLLELPRYGCLNIHASLLPKYRGAAPINRAIMDGEKETGISIMQMAEGLDTGDIVSVGKIAIEADDDSQKIHDELAELGAKMIVETLLDLKNGSIEKIKQDESRATYAEKIFRETGLIDWNMGALELNNFIRGLRPWPGAYTLYEGKSLKIDKIEILEGKSNQEVGKVLKVVEDGIKVVCGDGIVAIKEFQFPGKRMMKVEDYLRGNEFEEGIVLGE